jgi:hypothetical protein
MNHLKGRSVVQYGIRTPRSKSVSMVTEVLAEATHLLDIVGDGEIVERTVHYGSWRLAEHAPRATAS